MTPDVVPADIIKRLRFVRHPSVSSRAYRPLRDRQTQTTRTLHWKSRSLSSASPSVLSQTSSRIPHILPCESREVNNVSRNAESSRRGLNPLDTDRPLHGTRYARNSRHGELQVNPGSKERTGSRSDNINATYVSSLLRKNSEGFRSLAMSPGRVHTLGFQPTQRLSYPDLSSSSFSHLPGLLPEDASLSNYPPAEEGAEMEEPPSLSAFLPVDMDPFCSPRGFHIPQNSMKAALEAPAESEGSYWQYTLYSGPAPRYAAVTRHYCTNIEQMEKVSQLFMDEEVLGVDLEWKMRVSSANSIKENLSLIQVASDERVALFHVALFPGNKAEDFAAPTFRRLMESPDVLVTGVNIQGDCTRLRKYLQISCQGVFELSHLYKLVRFHRGESVTRTKRFVRLAQQVEDELGLPLLKGDVRVSDWSRKLDDQQFRYAASDAYAGVMLFHQMEAKRLELDPVPSRDSWGACCVPDPPRPRATATNAAIIEDSDSTDTSFKSFETSESDEYEASSSEGDSQAPRTELDDVTDTLDQLEISEETTSMDPQQNPSQVAKNSHSQEFKEAEDWAIAYMAEHVPTQREKQISLARLRAYHLWHYQHLPEGEVRRVLRDPPLKTITVVSYVCDVLYWKELPAEPHRLLRLLETIPLVSSRPRLGNMHRAATLELEKRSGMSAEEAGEQSNVGWCKFRARVPKHTMYGAAYE